MKIFIAVDSFKGSLSSKQAANAIKAGLKKAFKVCHPKVEMLVLADGGEGTSEAWRLACGGREMVCSVRGALGQLRNCSYTILPDQTAVLEIAASSGLPLINETDRNPERTSSYGMGEMILHALDQGCREFILGLGGSSTNDAGLGLLQALGYKFTFSRPEHNDQTVYLAGKDLGSINSIDAAHIDARLKTAKFSIACDVDNPFYGPQGAAHTYARQKGADLAMINRLDRGLVQFAEILQRHTGKDVNQLQGAGAAGGIAGSLALLLDSRLNSGFDLLANASQLEKKIIQADIIITGEGRLDQQSLHGKAPVRIARLANKHQKICIGLFGSIPADLSSFYQNCFSACFAITDKPLNLAECMQIDRAMQMLQNTSESIFRLWKSSYTG